ncbi:HORMA domain-containing protein 1 [Bombina bombina]|uniref:HORMA domain-containing protein 1 n=1 Tax=Bombina bombina TaxID=8345 RepID=UPI00235A4A55|nr:HORMA domain-containing protein 1 [Bombina bombina]
MWKSSVALPNRVATEQQSLVLVKRLLAVSVSCITYLRGLFPEYAYGTRYLEDICVKILREDKSCPGSTQLVKWMLGCYDALQKKYLRMVVLAIYTNPEDPQTFTECYQFKFKYTPAGPVMDFTSNKSSSSSVCLDVKKASILLIRKLYVLMQNLGPLPNDVCLTMKLFYYDEVTPTNYQPPGFKEGSCDGMMFEGEPMHLNVGEVATPYHVLKVKVTTEKDRMENIGKSILNDGETKPVTRAINLDKEEVEKTDHPMTDEMAQDNNNKVEKNDTESLNVEGLHLTCEEDDSMFDDSQSQGNSASQTDNKLSYSRRTRSGRIFHKPEKGLDTKKIQDLEGNMERSQPEKRSQPFEIQNSQDEPAAPKRRKFSEPKERF